MQCTYLKSYFVFYLNDKHLPGFPHDTVVRLENTRGYNLFEKCEKSF